MAPRHHIHQRLTPTLRLSPQAAKQALEREQREREQRETDDARASTLMEMMTKRKRKAPGAFELPNELAKSKNKAACIIYIKTEPGEDGKRQRGDGSRRPKRPEERICVEDLICHIENTPTLAKSQTLYVALRCRVCCMRRQLKLSTRWCIRGVLLLGVLSSSALLVRRLCARGTISLVQVHIHGKQPEVISQLAARTSHK